jgi:DNA-binding CsgD family transcriptional regulator
MLWTGEGSAAEYAHRAAGLSRATGACVATAGAGSVIAVTELVAGRFQTAAGIARNALELSGSTGDGRSGPLADRAPAPEEACLRAVIGFSAWYALDTTEARLQLDLARAALVPAVDPVGVELVRQLTARVLADEGYVAEARRAVASDAETLLTPPFLCAMQELLRGELALAASDLTATGTHIAALRACGWESAASFLAAASGLAGGRPGPPSAPLEDRVGVPRWEVCSAGAALYRLLQDLESEAASDEVLRRHLREILSRCAPQRLVRAFLPGAAVPGFIALVSREADEDDGQGFAGEVLHALSRADAPPVNRPISDRSATGVARSQSPEPSLLVTNGTHRPDVVVRPLAAARTRASPVLAAPALDTASGTATDLAPVPQLTNREVDVLTRLARGDSYVDVAQYLFITENTVKTHVASLYRKLNAGRRAEALRTAWALGLIAEVGATSPLVDG